MEACRYTLRQPDLADPLQSKGVKYFSIGVAIPIDDAQQIILSVPRDNHWLVDVGIVAQLVESPFSGVAVVGSKRVQDKVVAGTVRHVSCLPLLPH